MVNTNLKLENIIGQLFDRTIDTNTKLQNLNWIEKHWVDSIYETFWKAIVNEPVEIVQKKSLEVLLSVRELRSYPRIFRCIEGGVLNDLSVEFISFRFFAELQKQFSEEFNSADGSLVKASLDVLYKSYFRTNSQIVDLILCLVKEFFKASRRNLKILYGIIGYQFISFFRTLFFSCKNGNSDYLLSKRLSHLSDPIRLFLLLEVGLPNEVILLYLNRNSSKTLSKFNRFITTNEAFTIFECKLFLSFFISTNSTIDLNHVKFLKKLVSNSFTGTFFDFKLKRSELAKLGGLIFRYYKLGLLDYLCWIYLDRLSSDSSDFNRPWKYLESNFHSSKNFAKWRLETSAFLLNWLPWNLLTTYPLLVEILERHKLYTKIKTLITKDLDHTPPLSLLNSLSTVEVIDQMKALVIEVINGDEKEEVLSFLDAERGRLIETGDKDWLNRFFAPLLLLDFESLKIVEEVGAFFLLSDRNLMKFALVESYTKKQTAVADDLVLSEFLHKKNRRYSVFYFFCILPIVAFLQEKEFSNLPKIVDSFFSLKYWIQLHAGLTQLVISRLLESCYADISPSELLLFEKYLLKIAQYLDFGVFDDKEQYITELRPLKEQLVKLHEHPIFSVCSFIFLELLGYPQAQYNGPFSLEKLHLNLLIRLLSRRLLNDDSSLLGLTYKFIVTNSWHITESVKILLEEQEKSSSGYPEKFIQRLRGFSQLVAEQKLFSHLKINYKEKHSNISSS